MSIGTSDQYLASRQLRRREYSNAWQLDDIPGVIRRSFSPSPLQPIVNGNKSEKWNIKNT